jgi:ATP-dependent Clp protease adapter protein ClpS
MSWRVLLWDDNYNTIPTVAFVLHRVVGLPIGQAMDLPLKLDNEKVAEVAVFDDRFDAEVLTGRMQVFGLHSGVAPA